jgi:hypothetical protein
VNGATTATKAIAPLIRVVGVTVSEKSGSDLNPHYFWMAHEYTMALECGHTAIRIRDAYHGPKPEQLNPPLPQRVRCRSCEPKLRVVAERAPKLAPAYDPLASALVSAAMQLLGDDRQDDLFTWIAAHGRFIADDTVRARVYGTLGLHLVDANLALADQTHCVTARETLAAWTSNPTEENRTAVRSARQRVYGAQNQGKTGSNYRSEGLRTTWYARRAIHSALNVASETPRHAVDAVISTLISDQETMSTFHGKLDVLVSRREFADRINMVLSATADDFVLGNIPSELVTDCSEREGISEDSARQQLAENAADLSPAAARNAIRDSLRNDQPVLGPQHAGMLVELIGIYAETIA